jgi:hypothetical protein
MRPPPGASDRCPQPPSSLLTRDGALKQWAQKALVERANILPRAHPSSGFERGDLPGPQFASNSPKDPQTPCKVENGMAMLGKVVVIWLTK